MYENVELLKKDLKRFPLPLKGKKELEALFPYVQNSQIVLCASGYGPYEATKACWFVLTDANLFIVLKASMMGAPSVIAVPLRDIDAAIEDRGMLLSKLTLTTKGAIYTLHNAQKNDTTAFVTYFNKRKLELLNSETNASEQPVQNRAGQPDSTSTLSTQDVQQDVQTEKNHSQSVPTMPAPDLTAKDNASTKAGIAGIAEKKKPGCMTRILQIFLLFIILGAIGSFFDKDGSNKKIVDSPSTNNNQKVYEYKILSEEHNKLGGAKRFTYEIVVPLGLSNDELKQMLIDIAWQKQKEKDASGIWIFAFREDDKERNGGYTAGRCILAPDGDWGKAVNSSSNLKPVVDIAEVYSYNGVPLETGTQAIINKNATLYDKMGNSIGTVKKGTKVTILEHKRNYSLYAITEEYRISTNDNKGVTGWAFGDDLASSDVSKPRANINTADVVKPSRKKGSKAFIKYDGAKIFKDNGLKNSSGELIRGTEVRILEGVASSENLPVRYKVNVMNAGKISATGWLTEDVLSNPVSVTTQPEKSTTKKISKGLSLNDFIYRFNKAASKLGVGHNISKQHMVFGTGSVNDTYSMRYADCLSLLLAVTHGTTDFVQGWVNYAGDRTGSYSEHALLLMGELFYATGVINDLSETVCVSCV